MLMFQRDKTPYTWEILRERISKGQHLSRSDEVEELYEQQTEEQRQAFIEHIRKQLRTKEVIIEKNRFPYNVAPGIEHYVIWSKTSHIPFYVFRESWLNGRTREMLDMKNEEWYMSIPEIYHTHIFVRDIRRFDDRRLPKYLAHFTTLESLGHIGRTKIGKKEGFLCAKYNLHILGFDYGEDYEPENDPMKICDVEYNGVYFAPIFDERCITLKNGYFHIPNVWGKLEICLLMSTESLHVSSNWHYNFGDDAGIIHEATVFRTREIVYSENPEVIFHDAVSLENISAIVTTNVEFAAQKFFHGIPILTEFPTVLPEPAALNFVGPLPLTMDLSDRHDVTVEHHSK